MLARSLTGAVVAGLLTLAAPWALTKAPADTARVVYSFTGGDDGGDPSSALISDSSGHLYGTTALGGTYGHGDLFELALSRGRWHESVLHSFGEGRDGSLPQTTLAIDKAGDLFGTTALGGTSSNCNAGCGTVFELMKTNHGWREVMLHDFTNGPDGSEPVVGVSIGTDGHLYGTTEYGGINTTLCSGGCGTVFELSVTKTGWKHTVVYDFRDDLDGNVPDAPFIFGKDGSLYSTTLGGGNGNGCIEDGGCGTVFELTPSNGKWKEEVLYRFQGTGGDGAYPLDGLLWGPDGTLIGTTTQGGIYKRKYSAGTVFELVPNGSKWLEKVVYSFTGGRDGYFPLGTLVADQTGRMFGVTLNGGNSKCSGLGVGTVFQLDRSGSKWTNRVLYDFPGGSGGWDPLDGLTLLGQQLFGTTSYGGSSNYGVAFDLTLAKGGHR